MHGDEAHPSITLNMLASTANASNITGSARHGRPLVNSAINFSCRRTPRTSLRNFTHTLATHPRRAVVPLENFMRHTPFALGSWQEAADRTTCTRAAKIPQTIDDALKAETPAHIRRDLRELLSHLAEGATTDLSAPSRDSDTISRPEKMETEAEKRPGFTNCETLMGGM